MTDGSDIIKISWNSLVERWHSLLHQVGLVSLDFGSNHFFLASLERVELMHVHVIICKLFELFS